MHYNLIGQHSVLTVIKYEASEKGLMDHKHSLKVNQKTMYILP